MKRKRRLGFLLGALLGSLPGPAAAAGPPGDDAARRDLLPLPPSVSGGAVGGIVNPAAWATSGAGDIALWWNDANHEESALDNFGLSHGGPLGFSAERRTFGTGDGGWRRADQYRVGLAGGDGASHAGLAWRWAAGDDEELGLENGFEFGAVHRPSPRWSWGWTAFASVESGARSAVADLGVRPFASPWLTLFGDWTLTDRQRPADGSWSAGAEIRPVRGVHLGARWRDGGDAPGDWRLHAGVTLDGLGLDLLPGFDDDGERTSTSAIVRVNPPYRGIPVADRLRFSGDRRRFEVINLERRTVTYTQDLWFDDRRLAWIDLARRIREIRRDPEVDGVLVNLAGASIRPSILWELRTELAACREAGQEVVLHVDRVRTSGAYLASVADRVSMDPNGSVQLSGIALHRTYMKGLLDKLGIGFEELRFFPYKTAAQTWSRDTMSDEDREQYRREVDLIYEEFRRGICEGRGITESAYDDLVDGPARLRAAEAHEAGLVDELGRWDDLRKQLREDGVRFTARTGPRSSARHPDERWGRPRSVAVVYAVGVSEMDEGIRGRATSAYLRRAARRGDIAAVVLRSDSPGGDRLPSDQITDALGKVRAAGRPVVASQGDVAASAGYWITLEADHVYTTPLTLTGSIGVISGWVWDAGVGEKTGFSADGVQRGRHADLYTGIRFPGIGERLPGRPLTEDERERAEHLIVGMYDEFVALVAESRELPEEDVRAIAGGRVWMGADAVRLGLCDGMGTLLDAVEDAAARAGLDPRDVRVEEFPARRRFRLPQLVPSFPSFGLAVPAAGSEPLDYGIEYLRGVARRAGEPQLVVPPDALPDEWRDAE